MPLFRTTPSAMSGTQAWPETASNTEVRYPVSSHRPLRAHGITVGGDTTPAALRGAQVLEQHLPSARWLHLAYTVGALPVRPLHPTTQQQGWPTVFLSCAQPPLTSPGAFFCLLETDAPLCGETRAMLQKEKGPLPVLEVLQEQLRPSSSHV